MQVVADVVLAFPAAAAGAASSTEAAELRPEATGTQGLPEAAGASASTEAVGALLAAREAPEAGSDAVATLSLISMREEKH